MQTSLAAQVIEFTTLNIMLYEDDRTTAIGRPILMLMIDPICGCTLHEALSVSLEPADALIEALYSWQASKSPDGKRLVVLAGVGKALFSTAVTRAARSASFEIQHPNRPYSGMVERAVAKLTRGCEMKSGFRQNQSSKVTVAEMRQIVSISAAVYNQQKWKRTDINQAKNAYKPAGTGIPLEVRRLYSNVQQSSLEHGFDIEQVNLIWRTASLAYSVKDISSMFEVILEKFTSTITYHDHLRRVFRSPSPPFVQPAEMLEGKGAVAIRTLAHLKVQRDRQPFIWTLDTNWNHSVASWVDFTYALLGKLVTDGPVTDTLRCKLFARDLGL